MSSFDGFEVPSLDQIKPIYANCCVIFSFVENAPKALTGCGASGESLLIKPACRTTSLGHCSNKYIIIDYLRLRF